MEDVGMPLPSGAKLFGKCPTCGGFQTVFSRIGCPIEDVVKTCADDVFQIENHLTVIHEDNRCDPSEDDSPWCTGDCVVPTALAIGYPEGDQIVTPDGVVQVFNLRFSFGNWNLLPGWVPMRQRQERKVIRSKKRAHGGKRIIPLTKKLGTGHILKDLVHFGWALVDGYYDICIDDEGRERPAVYFIFMRGENVDRLESAEGVALRERLAVYLAELSTQSMWSTVVWRNPYFQDHEPAQGNVAICFNMTERYPLLEENGEGKMVNVKDEHGNPTGKKCKLQPEHHVRIFVDGPVIK